LQGIETKTNFISIARDVLPLPHQLLTDKQRETSVQQKNKKRANGVCSTRTVTGHVVFDALVNLCHAFNVVRRLVVVAEEHALHHGLAKRVLPRGAEPSE
jgi:hypothetical protein